MQDLTLQEVRDAFRALEAEIGSKAHVSAHLERLSKWSRNDCGPLVVAIYPEGVGGMTPRFEAFGATWRELVENARIAWAEHADTHAANTIRDMALTIIRLTHALGSCTDAALRAEFDGQDVERFGQRACARANEMAGSGPFSIVALSGANDSAEAA